jgi:hypothetical protein
MIVMMIAMTPSLNASSLLAHGGPISNINLRSRPY